MGVSFYDINGNAIEQESEVSKKVVSKDFYFACPFNNGGGGAPGVRYPHPRICLYDTSNRHFNYGYFDKFN